MSCVFVQILDSWLILAPTKPGLSYFTYGVSSARPNEPDWRRTFRALWGKQLDDDIRVVALLVLIDSVPM